MEGERDNNGAQEKWEIDKASQLMGWIVLLAHLERRDVLPLMAIDTVSKPRQIAKTGK